MKQRYSFQKNWGALELSGPDALDYLHRITTVNFKTMQDGDWTPGMILNSTGKIQLFFKVFRNAVDRYFFLVPQQDENADPGKFGFERLEQMHFRENFQIKILDDIVYMRTLSDSLISGLNPDKKMQNVDGFGGVTAFLENEYQNSKFDFGFFGNKADVESFSKALSKSGWTQADNFEEERISSRKPKAPNELNAKANPLELNYDLAIHENKGCYPGQEVIERIRSMGQVPKVMVCVQGEGSIPPIQSKVMIDGAEAGVISSAINVANGYRALAVVKRTMFQSYLKDNAKATVNERSVELKCD